MLSATSHRSLGSSTVRASIFLERRVRAHVMLRDRLLFDTTYCRAATTPTRYVHLFALLRGQLTIDGGTPVVSPCLYVLDDTEFDRRAPTSPCLRSWGAPGVIAELRVRATDIRCPVGVGRGLLAVPSSIWDAYDALEASHDQSSLRRLIHELCDADVLAPEVATSIVDAEPDRFVRVWSAIRPLYEDLAASTSLKQLAAAANISLRQFGRDASEMSRTFDVYGAGFRDAVHLLRLRAAVLYLSAPDATPSTVAAAVGYGSVGAMGRAFRDAKLPAPSVVKAAVRYSD